MKRRSRTGGATFKVRGRKTAKLTRPNVPNEGARRNSPAAETGGEVTRLTRELNEALEREAAASEVLHVISGTQGDLQRVFASVLANAVRLCEANFSSLLLKEGDTFRLGAAHNAPPAYVEFRKREPAIRMSSVLARVTSTQQLLHIPDCTEHPSYKQQDPSHRQGDDDFVRFVKLCRVRTLLIVPMLKDLSLIGAVTIYRQDVRPFTSKQIDLVKNFAAQAVIAIENARLLNELRQRTTDLTEALEQQTATSEVLQVISSSPGDLHPVFDAMLKNAARICNAEFGNIFRWDGEALHLVGTHNTPPALAEARERSPVRPDPNSLLARMFETKAPVHIADAAAEETYTKQRLPGIVAVVELGGARTVLLVPMLKENEPIGVFTLYRQEVRPFTDKQIELVKNFAAQAVIAIENARLLNELRQSLEQQTATSEVLQVISSCLGELEPVFQAMLAKATSICEAKFGQLWVADGDGFRSVASDRLPPTFAERRRDYKISALAPDVPFSRLKETKRLVHLGDITQEPAYIRGYQPLIELAEIGGARTLLLVPMLKEDRLVGAIAIYRQEVRPFTDKQIDLVANFAAQAVIAIENARLLNELRQRTTDLTEALEQQTATSEVLQVISSSPGAVEPIFAKMLENAARICDAQFGNIFQWDGVALHLVGTHNTPPAFAELLRRSPLRPTQSNNSLGRMLATKTVDQNADVAAGQPYAEHDPMAVAAVEVGGVRTVLNVPMLKDNELLGAFSIYRQEVRPFTDKQIELVKNFAAQAVIAIENARLLNELRGRTTDLSEALDQQTATSEVLQTISSSPGDVEPVFAAMLEKAVRICDAGFGNIYRWDGQALHLVAAHNTPPALAEDRAQRPLEALPNRYISRMVATKSVVHVSDLKAERSYLEDRIAAVVSAVELGGVRTVLSVPMLKEDELIGAIILNRPEVRPFTDKQVALVTNFAAQAVIAIENARLLGELRERTEEVVKLNQQLEQRVADQVGEIERMGRLRRFLPPQVADLIVASGTEKQLESHRREITALFCDLRGFTGFSEASAPEDVMMLLRDYHAAIGELIIKYSGTLERYAGDGVMVVFNDPVPVEKPALQAVRMALETRGAMAALMEKWRELGHDVGFGIGIAHGYATLGTIGFEGRFDYAAIGTVSNVASRLCDEAKPGQILISPRVFTAVKDAVKVEPVGEFTLKGIGRPLASYNVLAAVLV